MEGKQYLLFQLILSLSYNSLLFSPSAFDFFLGCSSFVSQICCSFEGVENMGHECGLGRRCRYSSHYL